VSNDDPVAIRMVSGVGVSAGSKSSHSTGAAMKLFHAVDGGLNDDDLSFAVLTAVGITTVSSLVAFVAVYVYLEATVVSYNTLD
jgi:hypothetical protein